MKKQLQAGVICTVCKSLPRCEKIPICSEGHLICEPCLYRMEERFCPTCDESMDEISYSPLALKITGLINYPCKFSKEGCSAQLPKRDIQNHEMACEYFAFRPCPGIRCGVKVSRMNYQHLNTCVGIKNGRFPGFGPPTAINWSNTVSAFCYRYSAEKGHLFFLSFEKDERSNDPIMLVREINAVKVQKKCSVHLEISITGSNISRAYRGKTVPLNRDAKKALDEGNAISVGPAFISNKSRITLSIERR